MFRALKLRKVTRNDPGGDMRARISTIPVASAEVGQLSALVVGADLEDDTAPVLLFLHGKGEAGSSLSALPLVCVHQTPPFQAILQVASPADPTFAYKFRSRATPAVRPPPLYPQGRRDLG